MGLANRLASRTPVARSESRSDAAQFARDDLSALARQLHQKIVDRLDLAAVTQLPQEELRRSLRTVVEQLVMHEGIAMTDAEKNFIAEHILDELTGYGPLEALLHDPTVSDVLVNGHDQVFVERNGRIEQTDVRFRDDRHLIHTIQRMVARIGRRIDESSPMVDARLADGSRVNAVIPPLAIDGPALSIRRFSAKKLGGEELVAVGAMSQDMLNYLYAAVRSRCSILISGGTGAGKTTMLNMLSGYISKRERIITVEDAAELRLQQPHVVRLESRPPNLEGKGEVSIRDLVRNALRMRPDRIIVGEVRGGEVIDMLQAMNTGHDGSMATVHANSPDDAMSRLMTMLGMSDTPLAPTTQATMITRAVDVVVQVSRMQDGGRRVTAISEVMGNNDTDIELRQIFEFERTGVSADDSILGRHKATAETTLTERFRQAGLLQGQ